MTYNEAFSQLASMATSARAQSPRRAPWLPINKRARAFVLEPSADSQTFFTAVGRYFGIEICEGRAMPQAAFSSHIKPRFCSIGISHMMLFGAVKEQRRLLCLAG